MAKSKAKSPDDGKTVAKRKTKKASATASPAGPQPEDAMTQCVALCQENRWREAALLCRRMRQKAEDSKKTDLYASLNGALQKIEHSLRRQMAAALCESTKELLRKEYLLDVGA